MTTTSNKSASVSREDMIQNLPGPLLVKSGELQSMAHDFHGTEGGINNWHFAKALLQFLPELMSLPRFAEVQALRVWLYPPENRSVQVDLVMANLAAQLKIVVEIPLDEAIAAWIWQHQRPLIITAQADAGFPDFTRLLLERGIQYFCVVPLITPNRRMGVLGLASTRHGALRNLDVEFLQGELVNMGGAIQQHPTLPAVANPLEDSRGEEPARAAAASPKDSFEGIVGRSAAMDALCQQIKVVAPTGSTVLILGETGTGKELIARAIHKTSPRRERAFIKVNCAAIPAGLIESELFGHERGAFTGALTRRTGRFEMADGGTLFLDEIGDIPLDLQPKLLRVLQEQEFERIGGTQTVRVNVRIVAATSRVLAEMVAAREFRADLYYRLNVFPIGVPALRERPEDIPPLVRHFVEHYASRANKPITEIPSETMDALARHPWPGNVRELQNVIERSVILSSGKSLQAPLEELRRSGPTTESVAAVKSDKQTTLKDVEREHIIQALAATNWVLGGPKGAGARLGLARTSLIAKMKKLGISRTQA